YSMKERERHSRPFCGMAYSKPSIVTVFFNPALVSHLILITPLDFTSTGKPCISSVFTRVNYFSRHPKATSYLCAGCNSIKSLFMEANGITYSCESFHICSLG